MPFPDHLINNISPHWATATYCDMGLQS